VSSSSTSIKPRPVPGSRTDVSRHSPHDARPHHLPPKAILQSRLEVLEDRTVPATLGWAVGGNDIGGTILHTADGGAHWSVQFQMPGIGSCTGLPTPNMAGRLAAMAPSCTRATANWPQTIIGIAHLH
jgi:hypothetical protein